LRIIGDKGSEYPEYLKLLKFKSKSTELHEVTSSMKEAMQWIRGMRYFPE
jgi:hypothetical protein